MILIADCGSTKIDWCLLNENRQTTLRAFTMGMNAVMLTREEMSSRLRAELMPELGALAPEVSEVYFYGAGCIAPEVCANVAGAISENIPSATKVEVYTDLLAAARALCGRKPGIACIMGTGANSCYYNGSEIEANVSPLGFILGDEGSGAVLGKLFLGDVLKNQLPANIKEEFLKEYNLTLLDIIRRVYKEPQPNRFLATVAPFIHKHLDVPEIHAMVHGAFSAFFRRNIMQYDSYGITRINFVGSIAHHFRPVLEEAARPFGYTVGTVLQSPMEGLIEYHS